MRVLRITLWVSPDPKDAITTIFLDRDVKASLEETLTNLKSTTQEGLVLADIFEAPDGSSLKEAGGLAWGRLRTAWERETNQACLFFHAVRTFNMLTPTGMMVTTQQAPLTGVEIQEVLEQLARHPARDGRGALVLSNEGTAIELSKDGKIATTKIPIPSFR